MSDEKTPREEGNDFLQTLPWNEIMAAQANAPLQVKGRRDYPPLMMARARGCPECGRRAVELAWIYYTNGDGCWMDECGMEGWIVACLRCRQQADFLPTLMS